jgi:gliding motility-associated-like protein
MQGPTRKQTIKTICSILMLLGWQVCFSQLIYYHSGLNIYSFDPSNCFSSLVIKAQRGFSDIAFDRNGNLYGCNTDLNRVYVSTGSVSKIADIGATLNGMTISYDDIIYMGDSGGELISYNINSGIITYHGNMGFGCAGDLTFYKGELYMAAYDFKIIHVDIEHPEQSEVLMTYAATSDILGIVSDYRGCDDIRVYGLTGDTSEVLYIDLENKAVTFVCQLPLDVLGGASNTEFLASIPITLGEPLVIAPDCKSLTGSVSFPNPSGTGDLEFRLDSNPWQSEADFNNLSAGFYSFYLRDREGCMDTLQIELKPYPLLHILETRVNPASCHESDGALTIMANGGTGVLTYSLNGLQFQLQPQFSGLSAGNYTCYVKDNSGCVVEQQVEVSHDLLLPSQQYDVLHASCHQGNGAIFLYPEQGQDLSFSINGSSFQEETIFSDLSAGIYAIAIQDQEGCTDTLIIEVGSLDAPRLELVTVEEERCQARNGSIDAIGTGGIPPLTFRLNNASWSSNSTFNHLKSGSFVLYMKDGGGCLDSLEVFVDHIDGPGFVTLSGYPSGCNAIDGRLEIEWVSDFDDVELNVWNDQSIPVTSFDKLPPGQYTISLADSSGCSTDTMATIFSTGCTLMIPNVFSPNGDGVNDFFQVGFHPNDPRKVLGMAVYDRWGNQVYSAPTRILIDSEEVFSWDGQFKNRPCPPGVYTFKLFVYLPDQEPQIILGDLTLIR